MGTAQSLLQRPFRLTDTQWKSISLIFLVEFVNMLPFNPSPSPLKVLDIFREAFGFAWGHRGELWHWIVLGAILTGLGDLVWEFSYGEEGWGLTGFPYFAAILLIPIPGLLVFVLLAVYCHRTFLIYHGGKDIKIRFFFTERERKFFAWVIGVPLGAILLIFPGFLTAALIFGQISERYQGNFWGSSFVVDFLFNVMVLFPLYYLLGRWILVFPAIAIEQDAKLGLSWKQTKENSWRMFFLVGFLPLTVVNIWYLLSFIGLSEFPVFHSFLSSFSLFLFTPVEVAVISIAFRELTNWTLSSQLPQST